MKYWIKYIVVIVLFLVAACQPEPENNNDIHLWIGWNADDLVRSWGPPDSSYQFQNGDNVIQFIMTDIRAYGSDPSSVVVEKCGYHHGCFTSFNSPSYQPMTLTGNSCSIRFILSSDRTIKDAIQHGYCSHFDVAPPPAAKAPPKPATPAKKAYCTDALSTLMMDGGTQQVIYGACQQKKTN